MAIVVDFQTVDNLKNYSYRLLNISYDVISNECIAGNGKIPERSVIQVST